MNIDDFRGPVTLRTYPRPSGGGYAVAGKRPARDLNEAREALDALLALAGRAFSS